MIVQDFLKLEPEFLWEKWVWNPDLDNDRESSTGTEPLWFTGCKPGCIQFTDWRKLFHADIYCALAKWFRKFAALRGNAICQYFRGKKCFITFFACIFTIYPRTRSPHTWGSICSTWEKKAPQKALSEASEPGRWEAICRVILEPGKNKRQRKQKQNPSFC